MEKRQRIQVDINRFRNQVDTLFFKQNDSEVYIVEVEILDNGVPYDLTGVEHVSFINETPISRSLVEGACSIVNAKAGLVERQFGDNEVIEHGEAKGEIKMYSAEKLLSSATFSYFIERSLDADLDATSLPELGSLKEALKALDEALENAEERTDKAVDLMVSETNQAVANTQEAIQRVEDVLALLPDSLRRAWRPNSDIKKGQIVYPLDPEKPIFLECIVSGQTGISEPRWGEVNSLISDGSVKWGVLDMRQGRWEFSEFRLEMWEEPKKGYRVASGISISQASVTVPALLDYLLENTRLIKTDTEWTALSNAADGVGGVPFYSYDPATDTLKTPDLRDMYFRASGTNAVGAYHGDAIRNFKGEVQVGALGGFSYPQPIGTASGVFYPKASGAVGGSSSSIGSNNNTLGFDVSRVVPTASENRTKAVVLAPIIFIGPEV